MARKISIRQAINEAIDQEMRRDPTVIVMGEDIVGGTGSPGEADAWGGVLGVTKGLHAKHGGRLMDTPLSESAYVGAAIGAVALFMLGVPEALVAAVAVAALFLAFRALCLSRIGGQTGDTVGALQQLAAIVILLVASASSA